MIESTADERVSYEFTASGRVEPGPQANLAETEGPDAINGKTASGSVALRGRLHLLRGDHGTLARRRRRAGGIELDYDDTSCKPYS